MQTEITEEIEKLKGKRGEHKEGIQVFNLHAPCMQNRHSVCIAGVKCASSHECAHIRI